MSFINSVAKSMNGIKTIETSELIFTDDNSTLNTSAGITQAQTTGQNALNKSISAIAFNTGTGVLTLTTQGTGVADLTQSLDGRYLSSTNGLVTTTGNQSISGVKTLSDFPAKSGDLNPSSDGEFATKKYVDDNTITSTQATAITNNTAKVGITTGSQSITGVKTFDSFPVKSGSGTSLNPSSDGEFATKKYVDDNGGVGDVTQSGNNNFTGTNTFNSSRPTSSLTSTTSNLNDFITKRDGDALYVNDSGNQSIAGVKTFSSFPVCSATTPTNPSQLANKLYVDSVAGGSAPRFFNMYGCSTTSRGAYQVINFSYITKSSGINANQLSGTWTSTANDIGYWLFIYTTSPTHQLNQTQYEMMVCNGVNVAGIYQGTQNGFHVTTIHTIRYISNAGQTCYNKVFSGTNNAFSGSPWGSFSGVKIG